MAYFQQIDELLKPKSSDLLAPQVPGQGQDPNAQPSQQLASPTSSTSIGTAPTGGKASSGAASNAAVQGKSPAEYTKVGYNPKAYVDQNQGAQKDLNVSGDTVNAAAQETQKLQQQSADFAKGQPQVPTYDYSDIQKAISGDDEAYKKLETVLAPSPLTPEQKAPDFSNLSAPEILSSSDALASKLKKASTGGQYTQGMADFDAALYKRSDAYQGDIGRAQKAVTDFQTALDAEIKKYEGTDRGAELIAARDQLRQKLGQEASDITGGIDRRLASEKEGYEAAPKTALTGAQKEFNTLVDAREDQIQKRLDYVNDYLNNERPDHPKTQSDMVKAVTEQEALNEAIGKIKGIRNTFEKDNSKYINMGGQPELDAPYVTTPEEVDRFEKIQKLLEGNQALQYDSSLKNSVKDPRLNQKSLMKELDNLIGLGSDEYGWNPERSPKSKGEKQIVNESGALADYYETSHNPAQLLDAKKRKEFEAREKERNKERSKFAKTAKKQIDKDAKKNSDKTKKSIKATDKKVTKTVAKATKKATTFKKPKW